MSQKSKIQEASEEELWARLRDWLQGADELRQLIDVHLSKKVESIDHPEVKGWNSLSISWTEATGDRGPYLKAQKQENVDYFLMVEDLILHHGKITREGEFFWLFSDGETVGRKPSKK